MKLNKIVPFILQALAWPPTLLFLKFFIHFEVRGKENLKGLKGPVIFASNHVSELDPILVRAALPMLSRLSPMFYVSRKNYLDSIEGVRKHIYGGLFFKAWGAYPSISGQKDYAISLRHHINLLKDGCSLCIFPEGKMSETGELGEVHGGTAFLAKRVNASVCRVTITNAYGINPNAFFKRKNRIVIELSKSISIDDILPHKNDYTADDYREAVRELMISR